MPHRHLNITLIFLAATWLMVASFYFWEDWQIDPAAGQEILSITGYSPTIPVLTPGSTGFTLQVNTSLGSDCKHGDQGQTYEQMSNQFNGDGTLIHTAEISNLVSGPTYHYYVRCQTGAQTTEELDLSYRVIPAIDYDFPRLTNTFYGDINNDNLDELSRYDLLAITTFYQKAAQQNKIKTIREYNSEITILPYLLIRDTHKDLTDPSLIDYPLKEQIFENNWFLYQPYTTIVGDIDEYATSIQVTDINKLDLDLEGADINNYIAVEDEYMEVTDIVGDTLTVVRGHQSDAVSHTDGDQIRAHIILWLGLHPALNLSTDWNLAVPEFVETTLIPSGLWDGVYYDAVAENLYSRGFDTDIDNDGIADDDETKLLHKAGIGTLFNQTRNISSDIYIVGNGYYTFYQYGNGIEYETFTGLDGSNWSAHMIGYLEWQESGLDPHIDIINMKCNNSGNDTLCQQEYQKMRYGLTSTLIGDGFYLFDGGGTGHNKLYWFDEYSVDLATGIPTTPTAENDFVGKGYLGQPSGDYSILANGVYRRNFANGVVLVNPTESEQDVELGETLRRIQGVQDTNVNIGGEVSIVTIASEDGIVLLSQICDEDWQCTEWSECIDSQRSRTCTDQNECGTVENQPVGTQACDSNSPADIYDLFLD
ncbi:MAG: putative glycoside hydrolase [Patescibacteria group bacterium]